MKRKIFQSADEALAALAAYIGTAPLSAVLPHLSDRVMKSTKTEDRIRAKLREDDADAERIENAFAERHAALRDFPRDAFQCFYSLIPRRKDASELSDAARRFAVPLLDKMTETDEYAAIKSVCEGRALPSYEAALEFSEKLLENADEFFKNAGDAANTAEKVKRDEERLKKELAALAEKRERSGPEPGLDRRIREKAERLASKARQVEALMGKISESFAQNAARIEKAVALAASAARDKAEETTLTLKAWGDGGADDAESFVPDKSILQKVRASDTLIEITKYLGRFKEIAENARKSGYAFGRGEKYTIEFGAKLGCVLTSEFAMLARPETTALFLRKYQTRRLKQYRRRDRISEGLGDIVVCLDESGSARDEAAWGKAVALALLDIAARSGRKFALIRFSGKGEFHTDLFAPGGYEAADIFAAAESYLGGGTDFETPLDEAFRLMENEGFEKADIVFATDGVCSVSEDFQNTLKERKAARGFRITGVLLDANSPGMSFSLEGFCDKVLRVSELSREQIAESLLSARA
jgi:uncharacterized protein with von Willebrand factor type A (vWA) domain